MSDTILLGILAWAGVLGIVAIPALLDIVCTLHRIEQKLNEKGDAK